MGDSNLSNADQQSADSKIGAPQVSWKIPKLPGVLPQSFRTWATLLVTSLMAVIIFCSPGTPKQKSNQPVSAQSQAATTSREVEQYKA